MKYKNVTTSTLFYLLTGPVVLLTVSLFVLILFTLILQLDIQNTLLVCLFVFIVVSLAALKLFLDYKSMGYLLDTDSLKFKQGFLQTNTVDIPFVKITNVAFSQTFFQKLFSVGTLQIKQEDSQNYFYDIDNKIAEEIMNLASAKSSIQKISSV